MKRFLASFLAVLMLAGMFSALAETAVTTVDLTFLYSVRLNEYTDTLYGKTDSKGSYAIYDIHGNALTAAIYTNMTASRYGYEVQTDHGMGFVDGTGHELIPAVYGFVRGLSEHWQYGATLTAGSRNDYDVIGLGSEKYYKLDTLDFYFDGAKVGTLKRSGLENYVVYGEYLYVKDRSGSWHYYDRSFTESGYSGGSGTEYDQPSSGGPCYHCGSGRQAFTAGCTLTASEVRQSVKSFKGVLYDLQGNVVKETDYDSVRDNDSHFEDGYAAVRKNGRYGLIDEKGNEVLACVYDELDISSVSCGWISAVKDGKQGFVRLADGAESGFVYDKSAVRVKTPFATVKNDDGTVTVLTAAAGKLPVKYGELSSSDTGSVRFAKDQDGSWCLIDQYGQSLVPTNGKLLDASVDGTLCLDHYENLLYIIQQ